MKKLIFLITILIIVPVSAGNSYIVKNYTLYISHPEPENFLKESRKLAAGLGGYTSSLRTGYVSLILPGSQTETFINKSKKMGYLNDEQIASTDVTKKVKMLETQLKVKKDYLNKLYEIFSGTNLTETLETEKEINRTIYQIESIEGQVRKYRTLSSTVRIQIRVSSSSQAVSIKQKESIFNWINNLGITSLYGE